MGGLSNSFSKGASLALFQRKSAELTEIAALAPADGTFLKRAGGAWTAAALAAGDIPNLDAAKITSGVLDNARVNWAAPSAIGGTTPAAGAFTTLSATTADQQAFTFSAVRDGLTTEPIGQFYNNAILRSELFASGAQKWYLNSGASEVGILQYTTPSSLPGIVLSALDGTGRSQIAQLAATGGLAFGATTGSGNPGTQVIINTSGFLGAGVNPTTQFHARLADATTAAVGNVVTIGHQSFGTPAAGFGAGLLFQLESSTSNDIDAARIRTLWTTATHASRVANLVLSVWNVGVETDAIVITPTTTGINIPSPLFRLSVGGTLAIGDNTVAREDGSGVVRIGSGGSGAFLLSGSSGSGNGTINTSNTVGGSLDIQTRTTSRLLISGAGLFTVWDGGNFALGTTTGTKIGTGATQKLSFWNATPVVQRTHVNDPSGGGTQDAEARTAINSILDILETLGLMAA